MRRTADGQPGATSTSFHLPREALASRILAVWRANPMLVVFLAAFSVRVAFILVYGPMAAPIAWGDDPQYDAIADRLVTQHEYVNTWFPPGYPLFLALVYAVFGKHWLLVRLIQAAMGAATCVLTRLLGAKVFSQREGLLAALLLAVYPGHSYISWRMMGETLYILLLVFSVLLAIELAENPRPLRALVPGATVGFAQLVKSNLFVFPPMLMVWFACTAIGTRTRRVQCLAVLIASFALVAFITPIANFVSPVGRAAALPGNAGHTFWFANNPLADGYYIAAEAEPAGKEFIEAHGLTERLAKADDFEKDRLYRTLGLLWIRENPGQFMVLCLKKLNNAFGLFPRAVTFEGNPLARTVHLLSYGLLAPFALGGMIGALRRWRSCSLLYVVLFSYLLMVLIFYGTPRFTIIVIPYLLLFASYAMVRCADYMSGRRLVSPSRSAAAAALPRARSLRSGPA